LAAAERFEHAAVVRDRIAAVVRACARMQRIASLTVIEELVAAHPDGCGGWELSVVKYGRLAAAGVAERGVPPWPVIDALLATADEVLPDALRPGPLPAALAEETECVLRWLEQPGTRLVLTSRPWTCPAFGAGGFRSYLDTDAVRRAADPFVDRRRLRIEARPARASA
jgi:DNA polymerase-3 subunit epsilon